MLWWVPWRTSLVWCPWVGSPRQSPAAYSPTCDTVCCVCVQAAREHVWEHRREAALERVWGAWNGSSVATFRPAVEDVDGAADALAAPGAHVHVPLHTWYAHEWPAPLEGLSAS